MQAKMSRSGRLVSVQPTRGSGRFPIRALLGFAFLAPFAAIVPGNAASATALAGDWSGEGTVTDVQGPTENVRCRVSYRQESAKVYGVEALCASTSKKMSQTGQLLEVRPGVYTGEFNLTQYDVTGRVRVVIDGDGETQTVTFTSSRGDGEFTLTRR